MRRLRLSDRVQHLNVTIFVLGCALDVVALVPGIELAGVKVGPGLAVWDRVVVAALGILLMVLSLLVGVHLVPLSPVPFWVPGRPARFVRRPDQHHLIRELLRVRKSVAVWGMGGAGKTVLAIEAASDPIVQRAFPDGIFWIEAGRPPNRLKQAWLVELQVRLARQLADPDAVITDVKAGNERLKALLMHRVCLVVIDNLWDPEALAALNHVGPDGCLMLTTRDQGLARPSPAANDVIAVAGLELGQARDLLAQWVGIREDELPAIADKLCEKLGNLALGLAITGGMVATRGRGLAAWDQVLGLLEGVDLQRIRLRFPPADYPYSSVLAAIEISIQNLPPEKRRRYRALVVFADRGPVPPSAVEALWSARGLVRERTDDLLAEFGDRSLIQRTERGWITLNDLLFDVILYELSRAHLGIAAAHGQLVDGYRSLSNGHLADLNDGYILENLTHHLASAERMDELTELLLDYHWIERKLEVSGLGGLLADYRYSDLGADVDAVQGALLLSAQALAREPSSLPGQLVGRLLTSDEPRIQAMLTLIREADREPWICPLSPALVPSGGPLIRILRGHTKAVRAVALTPDGRHVVSGSDDGTIRVWDQLSGLPVRTHEVEDRQQVFAVAVTPDNLQIVSGDAKGTVRVWDRSGERPVRTLTDPSEQDRTTVKWEVGRPVAAWNKRVLAVAVTPDGDLILTGGDDGRIRVWDRLSPRPVRTLPGHPEPVRALAVTPDGREIISGGGDGRVRVWDRSTGEPVRRIVSHRGWVLAVAVTHDGRQIISGGDDGIIRVWDRSSPLPVWTLEGHAGPVRAVAVSPDDSAIVSAGDRTVRIWDRSTGKLVRIQQGHAGEVWAVAVSSDGARVVSASADRTVHIADWAIGGIVRSLEGHSGSVRSVAVSPDGSAIVSAGDRSLHVWDQSGVRRDWTPERHNGRVLAVAFSPDSAHIASGGDRTVQVWNPTTGEVVELEHHTGAVRTIAFSPDGQDIAFAGGDDKVRVWSPFRIGDPVLILEDNVHPSLMLAVSPTPDNREIVAGGADGTIRVWDRQSRELWTPNRGHDGPVLAVAVTHDGRQIISGGADGTIRVWDLQSYEHLRTIDGRAGRVRALALSADSRQIVSAGDSPVIHVWDRASGWLVRVLEGHKGRVLAVAVNPENGEIVSAGDDRVVHVWDRASGWLVRTEDRANPVWAVVATPDSRHIVSGGEAHIVQIRERLGWRLLRTLDKHTGPVLSVAVSPDGSAIVSGGDRTIRVWDWASDEPIDTLRGLDERIWAVAVSSDEGRILSCGDRIEKAPPGGWIRQRFGAWILTMESDIHATVKLWDRLGRGPFRTLDSRTSPVPLGRVGFNGLGPVRTVAVGSNGQLMAWAGDDSNVYVRDRANGELIRPFKGHTGPVLTVAIAPDGRHLVSGSEDTTVRVWDRAGKPVRIFEGHRKAVRAVGISPDGRWVMSGGEDGTIQVWDPASGRKIAHWISDELVWILAVSSVPDDARLIAYGDSIGGVHLLRLMGPVNGAAV